MSTSILCVTPMYITCYIQFCNLVGSFMWRPGPFGLRRIDSTLFTQKENKGKSAHQKNLKTKKKEKITENVATSLLPKIPLSKHDHKKIA